MNSAKSTERPSASEELRLALCVDEAREKLADALKLSKDLYGEDVPATGLLGGALSSTGQVLQSLINRPDDERPHGLSEGAVR